MKIWQMVLAAASLCALLVGLLALRQKAETARARAGMRSLSVTIHGTREDGSTAARERRRNEWLLVAVPRKDEGGSPKATPRSQDADEPARDRTEEMRVPGQSE